MLVIVDYGVGNLFSLKSSFEAIGADVVVSSDGGDIERADKIILPGVGAFGDAITKLRNTGLDKVIAREVAKGKKLNVKSMKPTFRLGKRRRRLANFFAKIFNIKKTR